MTLRSRRRFLQDSIRLAAATVGISHSSPVRAAIPTISVDEAPNLLPAPDDPNDWPAWREALLRWRTAAQARLRYDDALYQRPDFAWTKRCFSCGFLMLADARFYDARTGRYRVNEFLDDHDGAFGGFDAVVLWHAYPRIGVDERNQFDCYRDMPGGLPALRRVARAFRQRGVRVFIDYNPWDTGTRREGLDDLDALAQLAGAIEADGIFLDTLSRGASAFRAKLDAVRRGVVLEGEIALPLENLHDHHLSWAQWFADSAVPGVLRNKWFEPRHLQHQIKRWDPDHTGELQAAWMNGSGMMVWENVFGSWMGWSERDRTILRAMLPIQRRYADLFCAGPWTPLVPALAAGVFANLWEKPGIRLWTLVNRTEREISGPLLQTRLAPGERAFDLIQGRALPVGEGGAGFEFATTLPPRGIGCLLIVSPSHTRTGFRSFLDRQVALHRRARWNRANPIRPTRLMAVAPTRPASRLPKGMCEIPAAELELTILMRNRECGFYESTPQPGHALADSYRFSTREFRRRVAFPRFAIDRTPVTNAQYRAFLEATPWRPRHRRNFLRHWPEGRLPAGLENHPVVHVDLDDARAYARWAGKRLPSEEEWQYAAQGTDGRSYPWGNTLEPGRCNAGESGATTPVEAFPDGASPFGVLDLCGNTWEWTESERTDGVTRFCILRGGSHYRARGSNWYVDGGPRPVNFATKFLQMWPGFDRCSTVGFRCVVDLETPSSP